MTGGKPAAAARDVAVRALVDSAVTLVSDALRTPSDIIVTQNVQLVDKSFFSATLFFFGVVPLAVLVALPGVSDVVVRRGVYTIDGRQRARVVVRLVAFVEPAVSVELTDDEGEAESKLGPLPASVPGGEMSLTFAQIKALAAEHPHAWVGLTMQYKHSLTVFGECPPLA